MDRFQPPPPSQQQAWISASTAEMQERTRTFIRSVYAWMFGGLLLTALAAAWVVMSPAMQQLIFGTPGVMIFLILAELGIVFFLSFRVTKMSPGAAAGSFLVYSVLNGLTLSVVFFAYTQASIANAFLTTAATFGAMSIYGYVTKKDLTSWGSFFMMGVIGLILAGLVNIFLKSSALDMTISVIGVFVFLGLTAYDTQKLKSYATAGELRENLAVYGALSLYLDFINLFLFLLRLFGSRRD